MTKASTTVQAPTGVVAVCTAEGIPPDEAPSLRWPHRLGIKLRVVQAGWSGKHRKYRTIWQLASSPSKKYGALRKCDNEKCTIAIDRNLLSLQDPVAIIPTGGGKSFVWLLLAVIGVQNIALLVTYLFAKHNKYRASRVIRHKPQHIGHMGVGVGVDFSVGATVFSGVGVHVSVGVGVSKAASVGVRVLLAWACVWVRASAWAWAWVSVIRHKPQHIAICK